MVRGQHSNGERMQAQSVPYDRILLHAAAIGTLINESKSPAHRGRRWRRTDRGADRTVAVQVLLETGLERLQRSARSRHDASSRDEIAAVVGVPHLKLIGAGHLPGHLIPVRRLLCANRRPGAIL